MESCRVCSVTSQSKSPSVLRWIGRTSSELLEAVGACLDTGFQLSVSRQTLPLLLLLTIVYLNLLPQQQCRGDWPQLRGPSVNGRASTRGILSRTQQVQLQVRWKAKLGNGYSSVSTFQNKAVTAFSDRTHNYVVCISIADGQTIWVRKTGVKWVGKNGAHNGPIATPAIGFGKVFMLTPQGRLLALDLKTGDPIWEVDMVQDWNASPFYYGFGTSPIVHGDDLFVQIGAPVGTVSAINPETGEIRWSVGNDKVGYQTPVPSQLLGRPVMLVAGGTTFSAVETTSQKSLVEFKHQGTGGRGVWSLAPVPFSQSRVLLTHDDIRSQLLDIKDSNNPTPALSCQPQWQSVHLRNSYNVPIVVDNKIYAFSSRVLTCVDEQGQPLWKSRQPGDGFLSETDGTLVLLTKEGSLHLVNATPDRYSEIANLQLFDDLAWSVPAIHQDSILVRSQGEIACVDMVPGKAGEPNRTRDIVSAAPRFQRWLDRLESSPRKQRLVDQFLSELKSTPYIEGDIVHFLVAGNYDDVAVASDLFGARQERSMTRVRGTNLFYLAAKAPTDLRASYVFLADYKTITDARNPRHFRSSIFAEDIEMQTLVGGETIDLSWFEMPGRPVSIEPLDERLLSGSLTRFSLVSKAMAGKRIPISVLEPSGYDSRKVKLDPAGKPLPLVIFHGASAANESGKITPLLDQLMDQQRIQPALIVFVHSKYDPTAGASGYEKMIADELLPRIEKHFYVAKDRQQRSSVGAGFDGLMALSSALSHRHTFGRVGVHGIHLFHLHFPLIEKALQTEGPPCDILLLGGRYELRNPQENWDMTQLAGELKLKLDQGKQRVKLKRFNDGTDWICWRTRCQAMFEFLLEPASKSHLLPAHR